MPHLTLGPSQCFQIAGALLLAGVVLRLLLRGERARVLVPAAVQGALLVSLYGVWGLVGQHAEGSVTGAVQRGQALWDGERALHVLSEATAQSVLMPHATLTQAANVYYVYGHVNVLLVALAWVWFRHRHAYLRLCVVLMVFTAASTAVQLVSVAPPRLLPGRLVVDTAVVYGQSVYGPADPGALSQHAAMPSIHVGWALLVGFVVARLGRGGWRWVGLVHAVLMSLVVVVTGNHYWVDGVVAGLLLAAAALVVGLGARALARRPRGAAQSSDEPCVSTANTGSPR